MFFLFELELIGYGQVLMIFHKLSLITHHNYLWQNHWTVLSTVAHNCHGKTKNLTAKTKTSRKNQKLHGKNKIPHDKTKNLTAKPKTSRQNQTLQSKNQIPHGKSKYPRQNQSYFAFAVKYLVLPWGILFLPWGFWICRDSCGPP